MVRALSASTVKAWFQYRCERKVRYELASDDELASVPIRKDVREQSWAILGRDYEERVLRRLARDAGLLRPATGEFGLSEALAVAFLRGRRDEPYAAQVNLRPRLTPGFLRGSEIELRRVFPDLIRHERKGQRSRFTVADVKATRHATPFHKTQVAFYVRVLEAMLDELGQSAEIDPTGEIWRIPDDGFAEGDAWFVESFALAPYLRLVDEFCAKQLPAIGGTRVDAVRDETFFHLYFKCEQCAFLEHCRHTVAPEIPPAARDVSAVAGLTHEGKRSLNRLNVRTVGALAAARGLAQASGVGWTLSRRADLLVTRARAFIEAKPLRTEEAHTFLMPPRVDAAFLVSIDHDPVDDRLAAVGYRLVRNGQVEREVIEVPADASAMAEAGALIAVLGRLIIDLEAIDSQNQAGAGVYAHIFFYEPAEAVNLQRAVGRNLDDPRIRGGLLHLVRLFPPEDVVPEPEFRGAHHLPATAVRSVVEQLYALPVMVAYDLRQVSKALFDAGHLDAPYHPAAGFERPFSALLSIDVIRGLREGRRNAAPIAAVRSDVASRLVALQGVVGWLLEEHAAAPAPLLRLTKRPFRFHATFDPLDAEDLDLLLACELLENRAGLLEALIGLAQPLQRRRDAGRCLAGLTLRRHWVHRGRRHMIFQVPQASWESELGHGAFNLILTDDDPDLRLDPSLWADLACRIELPGNGFEDRLDQVRISVADRVFNGPVLQAVFSRAESKDTWCVDQAFGDVNSDRAARFIADLAGNAAP